MVVSQARIPSDSTVLWLLPPHDSVGATETIRSEEQHPSPLPQQIVPLVP